MKLHMVVEQTKSYRKRIRYNPDTNTFHESEYDSLAYVRHFTYPYGWIKESGTPPEPHWDVILMTEREYELGDEVEVRVIGVFMRNDGDHKYIGVEVERAIKDFEQLKDQEKADLSKLYPYIIQGEGWFGREHAEKAMIECEKAL